MSQDHRLSSSKKSHPKLKARTAMGTRREELCNRAAVFSSTSGTETQASTSHPTNPAYLRRNTGICA